MVKLAVSFLKNSELNFLIKTESVFSESFFGKLGFFHVKICAFPRKHRKITEKSKIFFSPHIL
jgi:hypothetical protein